MNLIAAVSQDWCIGNGNQLLVHIPEDMKFFKQTTLNKIVVMGKNTYDSLPNGPLKNRTNIVLTTKDIKIDDVIIVHSFNELFETLKLYNDNDIYIIGGRTLYNSLMPFCKNAFITKVTTNKVGNVYINNIDSMKNWYKFISSNEYTYKDMTYQFIKYVNYGVKKYE